MNAARLRARAFAGAGLAAATAVLLRRMHDDFDEYHRLRTGTMVLVYGAYVAHAAAAARLSARPLLVLPVARTAGRCLGIGLGAAGTGTFLAGARRFGSLEQLSGTANGGLVTSGVYRWTRNPQYLGYLAVLAGAGLTARSVDTIALTGASAAVLDHWVRREEDNLRTVFGARYLDYLHHSARWLGPLVGPAGWARVRRLTERAGEPRALRKSLRGSYAGCASAGQPRAGLRGRGCVGGIRRV